MLWRRPTTAKKRKKRPGRKRLLAGWLLLVIGVLITGVWGASRWWWCGLGARYWRIEVANGWADLSFWNIRPAADTGWFGGAMTDEMRLWSWLLFTDDIGASDLKRSVNFGVACYLDYRPQDLRGPSSIEYVHLVLWPFALASLLGGGWLVWSGRRARRRAMSGMCRTCGYDLSGLGAGLPCPECGKAAIINC